MKLFLAHGPVHIVAVDLVGPLKKTARGNNFTLVIAALFSQMTRSISLQTSTARTDTAAVLEYWVYSYDTAQYISSSSGKQPVAKFFDSVRGLPGFEHYLTTAYRPQTYD